MARITVEDCLKRIDNMYELVHITTRRARQLYKGSSALVRSKNRLVVTALREIAAGKVTPVYETPAVEGEDSDFPASIAH